MIQLLTILLLGFTPVLKDPPVKLIALKQSISKAKPDALEMTMEGNTKTKASKQLANYLIWLASKDLKHTKIVSVKINGVLAGFDTAHIRGVIVLNDGLRMPKQQAKRRVVQDSSGSSIRIYIKDGNQLNVSGSETITVRYKHKGSCVKKIHQSIEVLPVSIRE